MFELLLLVCDCVGWEVLDEKSFLCCFFLCVRIGSFPVLSNIPCAPCCVHAHFHQAPPQRRPFSSPTTSQVWPTSKLPSNRACRPERNSSQLNTPSATTRKLEAQRVPVMNKCGPHRYYCLPSSIRLNILPTPPPFLLSLPVDLPHSVAERSADNSCGSVAITMSLWDQEVKIFVGWCPFWWHSNNDNNKGREEEATGRKVR